MIHHSRQPHKHAGKVAVAPSRNYTLFDIALALVVLLFLLVSWNTAGATGLPTDDEPTPVCVTVEPDAVGCLIPPVTWVAPTAPPIATPTFEPTPTIAATGAGPDIPTAMPTPAPTLRPISRCSVLPCLFLPLAARG